VTAVRVQHTLAGLTYRVSFAYNPDLVALLKSLPQQSRRFDKVAGCWRVKSSHIAQLLGLLELGGYRVIWGRGPGGA
jgi:hypothetical protein